MPRLPLVPEDADDPRLSEVFDYFRTRDRAVPDLYRTLGNAPALLQAWGRFAWPLRADCTTSRGLRELVIMRVAQLTDAVTEWDAHWDMAVTHGNPPEKLAELATWATSGHFDDLERLVLAFVDEMTAEVEVSEATFAALAAELTPQEVVEITLTAAFYSCVSRVLRTLDIEPHADRPDVTKLMRP